MKKWWNKWLKVGLAVGLLGGCAAGLAIGQTVFTNPAPQFSMAQNGIPVASTANDLMVAGPSASQLQDESKVTTPAYASGGCTTTPATTGSPYAWTLTNGASGCGSNSTITLTFPTAGNNGSWVCSAYDSTAPTTTMVEQSNAVSTTSVVLTNYTRTTGVVLAMVASHVIIGHCVS